MQEELARLQSNNCNLSETVSSLRAQIAILQRENTQLKRSSTGNIDWDSFDMSGMNTEALLSETNMAPGLKTELSNDSGIFDVRSANKSPDGTQLSANEASTTSKGQQRGAAMIAEAIADAAAALKSPR